MDEKELAKALVDEVKGLPEVWNDLQKAIMGVLVKVAERGKKIAPDMLESKDKFLGVLAQVIDILYAAPYPLEAIDDKIAKIVLKILDKHLLERYVPGWFDKLKNTVEGVTGTENA